jgi:hypothetical protein
MISGPEPAALPITNRIGFSGYPAESTTDPLMANKITLKRAAGLTPSLFILSLLSLKTFPPQIKSKITPFTGKYEIILLYYWFSMLIAVLFRAFE